MAEIPFPIALGLTPSAQVKTVKNSNYKISYRFPKALKLCALGKAKCLGFCVCVCVYIYICIYREIERERERERDS
jgi:hypothetical protein